MVHQLGFNQEVNLDKIVMFIKNYTSSSSGVKRIQVNSDDILYLKALSNYTEIFLQNGKKILLSKTLKQIAESLPDSLFLRVHKSYLINKLFMRQYISETNAFIVMENGENIPVSRQRKSFVKLQF